MSEVCLIDALEVRVTLFQQATLAGQGTLEINHIILSVEAGYITSDQFRVGYIT